MGGACAPCQSYRCETPVSESTTYGKAHLTSYVRGRMGQELSKRRICAESSVFRASIPTGYDPRSRGGRLLKKKEVETLRANCQSPPKRKDEACAALMLLVRCGLNEGERSGGKFKTSASLKRGGALLIAKVGFDIESEMRLTLAESVEAER